MFIIYKPGDYLSIIKFSAAIPTELSITNSRINLQINSKETHKSVLVAMSFYSPKVKQFIVNAGPNQFPTSSLVNKIEGNSFEFI